MAAKSSKSGGNWVTINGVHVLIENGKITKGPAKFIGSTLNDLPSSGNSAADRKAELKAKYANKTGGSAPKEPVKESPKTTTAKATTNTTSKSTRGKTKTSDNATKSGSTKTENISEVRNRLESLEGSLATGDRIKSSLNRVAGGTYVGGRTTFKNAYGEDVHVNENFRGGVEVTIYHRDGTSSGFNAPTFEKQVKGRGGKMKTVKEIDYDGLANMINDNRYHMNSPSRVPNGKYDRGLSTHNYETARDAGTYKSPTASAPSAKAAPKSAPKSASTSSASGKYANKSAKDILIERKTETYKQGGYSASEAKELAKYVVNEEIKLSSNKAAYSKKDLSAKETLSLVHGMERSGLTDVYGRPSTKTPVQNSYGTTDKVSRTAGKVSRAGTSVKTASATPSAQAAFNNAVSKYVWK